jgi:glycosyltransferase involved in cell wall biosynthesis
MKSKASADHPAPPTALKGRRAAVIALSHYPWDPRIHRETEALIEAGMSVDLFCVQEANGQPRHETVHGVNVTRMRLRRTRADKLSYLFEYGAFFLWGLWRLTVAGLRRRYDVVHVHNLPDILVFTTIVPRLRGARIILDLHDPMPELFRTIYRLGPRHPFVRLLTIAEYLSTRYADMVVTPNQAFRELFVWRSHLNGKVNVIMNTPEEGIFHLTKPATADLPAAPAGNRPFRLMYHGLIAERHGLDTLLQAVQLVAADIPGVTLDIYGGHSAFLDTIEAMIRQLNLGDRVHYHGMKPLAEIAAIIETIDLGIVPNRRNPFTELNLPTRIFEYLSLRKPVIALNTEGVRDYFNADEMFLVQSDSPADLAETIRRAYRDPLATRHVVERGYQVYLRHRWHEEKDRFVSLVAQLVTIGYILPG